MVARVLYQATRVLYQATMNKIKFSDWKGLTEYNQKHDIKLNVVYFRFIGRLKPLIRTFPVITSISGSNVFYLEKDEHVSYDTAQSSEYDYSFLTIQVNVCEPDVKLYFEIDRFSTILSFHRNSGNGPGGEKFINVSPLKPNMPTFIKFWCRHNAVVDVLFKLHIGVQHPLYHLDLFKLNEYF